MNRAMRRASQANGRRMQRMEWNAFKDVTDEAIKRHKALNPGSNFTPNQVLQNNKYIVQIFFNVVRKNIAYDKLMIRRSDAKPIYLWQDLFRIKNEIYGPEVEAIQFFPAKSELTDVANLYWLFIKSH